MADGIGLSIGATALRAVAIGRAAVTRSPVLTRYPHRPAEVGLPSENPNVGEPGLVITDFVDRVGDPVPIVASDGSSHRPEALVTEALTSLLFALTGGRPPAEPVGVTYPAHWRPAAVDALRRALAGRPELAGSLTPDAAAALTALRDDPGLPTRGLVALCDVGGTGSGITLADAANGFQPIGPSVRYPDFSGDLVDQALLTRVVADLTASGAVDLSSTSAIGNLSRLRGQCRGAKERLSTSAVTSLTVDLPGRRTEVRLTRTELDDAVREPLGGFVDALHDVVRRSGARPGDLAAVALVGGSAHLPILVTTLSERLRVPVVTSPRPELAAAIGGGLTAVRGVVPEGATAMAPVPVPVPPVDPGAPQSSTFRALAWSDADDIPEPAPAEFVTPEEAYEPDERFEPRPRLAFTEPEGPDAVAAAAPPWYRRPLGMALIGVLALLVLIAAAVYYLMRDDSATSPAPSTPSTSSTSPAAPVNSEAPPPSTEAPAPERTVYEQAPPQTVTQAPPSEAPPPAAPPPTTTEAPPTTTEAPPTTTAAPSTVTVTESPSSSTQQPLIPSLPYQTIPGLPFVPAPIQPASP
ncbi:Hsp70 family protein [Mycolicibacterium sp. 050158]|uniref:Hsp70 family protein n=1 Tax=Mycolicibacterium sp. 050158 TaxID=3090602 RepID=UPI00299F51D2|nr:Hsp70 family protein [Mycolicibacterium sp. 050158]MDX1891103.1 Hsp70 family protein [Mycolicibacterium sp. 050158]